MNQLLFLTFFILSYIPCTLIANAQDANPILVNPEVGQDISKEIQTEITTVIADVISTYGNCANFWDAHFGTFDDAKYARFIALFAGDATVINDIGSTKTILHYSDYAALAFKALQIEGVPFELENIEIKSIDIDETGFYVAEVALDKIIYVGLDKKDRFYKIKKGKRIPIHIKIDMPDYLISDARIQSISEAPKLGLSTILNGCYDSFLQWPLVKKLTGDKKEKQDQIMLD